MKRNDKLDETYICELYRSGISTHQISKILKVSRTPIQRILHEQNVNLRGVGHPKLYTCNDNIFQGNNEVSFYLAGFIAADGSLREQKYSKVLKISISLKDKDHLETIQQLFDNNSPLKEYKALPQNGKICNNNAKHKEYIYVEMTITSSQIFTDLQRFNIVPNKTHTYELPDWLMNHKLANHFIRGYIDGDGSICSSIRNKCIQPQVSLSLIGNYKFLQSVNKVLIDRCKVRGSKIKKKPQTKHTYRIRYTGNLQMQNIGHFLYDDASVFLNRKYEKIKNLLS
jgi:intein-encoded DNA endonuclease-like protein